MKAVLQRVLSASVTVDGKVISSIGKGLLVLVGLDRHDDVSDSAYIIKKILQAKLFDDEATGAMWKLGVKDIQGEVLCVHPSVRFQGEQTRYLLTRAYRLTSDFHAAMATTPSRVFYAAFLQDLGKQYDASKVQDGEFGAMMQVSLVNDGPVTILLDSREKKKSSSSSSSLLEPELP